MRNSKITRILKRLPSQRKYQAMGLIVVILLAGLSQGLLVASVSPFLELISNPDNKKSIPIVNGLITAGGEGLSAKYRLLMGCLTFGTLAACTGFLRLIAAWGNGELSAGISSDLSQRCYSKVLHDSYAEHLKRNSSSIIGDLRQVDAFTSSVIAPSIQIASSTVTIGASAAAALAVSWQFTVLSMAIVGAIYLAISWRLRRPLKEIGAEIVWISKHELKIQNESLGAIRDVILDDSQQVYIDTYMRSVRRSRRLGARMGFLQIAPRYCIEAGGFIAIAAIGWILAREPSGVTLELPALGALAVAYQSILPSLQQIYSCWASFKTGKASIDIVYQMSTGSVIRLNTTKDSHSNEGKVETNGPWSEISFSQVSFCYEVDEQTQDKSNGIRNVDFRIKAGEQIGIIGETGSGKSTTVDLLLGLLRPSDGRIMIDKNDLGTAPWQLERWRNQVAHVPQHIFLSDSSIAENIAFGQHIAEIDWERMESAAANAQLTELVRDLAEGWHTVVGERGTRLSGGQRQRIGLARALYKQSSLLVLDEATSALDYITEAKVMDSIRKLRKDTAVVMIAHRIKTLRLCDRIFVFKNGTIIDQDKYDNLVSNNSYFRKLSALA